MKQYALRYLLCCGFGLVAGLVAAQETGKKEMLNFSRSPEGALIAGGGFFVRNPAPDLEVDMREAYHDPAWQPASIELSNGTHFTLPARYCIYNQRLEVQYEGEGYYIPTTELRSFTVAEARFQLFPPLKGMLRQPFLYEVHYRDSTLVVLERHFTIWKEPRHNALLDTGSPHRTLARQSELWWMPLRGGKAVRIRGAKDFWTVYPATTEIRRYARSNNLHLGKGDDIARILTLWPPNE